MKIFVLIIFCLALVVGVQAQTAENEDEAKVTKLTLAKKDADENIVENPESFNPKDIPIICYIDLNTDKPTLVKMKLVAFKAKGLRLNSQVIAVQYKTKDGENGVTFDASPKTVWAEGDYKVEIYLNGKLAESLDFRVINEDSK